MSRLRMSLWYVYNLSFERNTELMSAIFVTPFEWWKVRMQENRAGTGHFRSKYKKKTFGHTLNYRGLNSKNSAPWRKHTKMRKWKQIKSKKKGRTKFYENTSFPNVENKRQRQINSSSLKCRINNSYLHRFSPINSIYFNTLSAQIIDSINMTYGLDLDISLKFEQQFEAKPTKQIFQLQ